MVPPFDLQRFVRLYFAPPEDEWPWDDDDFDEPW